PDISSQERIAAIERWGVGAVWAGDAGEALDIFVEVKAAIEAPLIAGEITLGVLRVERATTEGDRALDVSDSRVRPLEPVVVRSPAARHDRLVLEPTTSASPPKQPRSSLPTRAPGAWRGALAGSGSWLRCTCITNSRVDLPLP